MSTEVTTAQEGTATRPTLSGPHPEFDYQGNPTGAWFVRCEGCGREVIAGYEDNLIHAPGCEAA